MTLDLTTGIGTALLLVLFGALLLRGRFGKRPEAPRKADPAARWLQADVQSTPPARDSATRSGADDPGHPDGDGGSD